jgi:hypothetical protein
MKVETVEAKNEASAENFRKWFILGLALSQQLFDLLMAQGLGDYRKKQTSDLLISHC